MKKCTKCGKSKELTEFYKHKQIKDGRAPSCKVCHNISTKRWRENNTERSRELSRDSKRRERDRDGADKTREKWNDWYAKNSEHRREYTNDRRDPVKERAHKAVEYAVKKGDITKPELCSDCNKDKRLDAHHEDYDKPLEVMWLCRSCHTYRHK